MCVENRKEIDDCQLEQMIVDIGGVESIELDAQVLRVRVKKQVSMVEFQIKLESLLKLNDSISVEKVEVIQQLIDPDRLNG